jgi:uncharacterized protein YdhG (YjbR/CyaY superfamily)
MEADVTTLKTQVSEPKPQQPDWRRFVDNAIADLDGFDSTKGGIRFTDTRPIPDAVFDRLVLDRRDEIDAALAMR